MSFNLVTEKWVPVADRGRVSLRDIFSQSDMGGIGGNPMEKVALYKFLQALTLAAIRPEKPSDIEQLTPAAMAEHVLGYLEQWQDRFDLFGEYPFLQMPAVKDAHWKEFGSVVPEVAGGNATLFFETERERVLEFADQAVLLIWMSCYSFGGKQSDPKFILSKGYAKPKTARPGPALGMLGYLHNFVLSGDSLWDSLYYNLISEQEIAAIQIYPEGLGKPAWEEMPTGEADDRAKAIQSSFLGRLVPLCRFCLLEGQGLHLTEGLGYGSHLEGVLDPSVAFGLDGKKIKVKWTQADKRPWREATALLSFLHRNPASRSIFNAISLQYGMKRARALGRPFSIWSAGIQVKATAGEFKVSGSSDTVESSFSLQPQWFDDEDQWIANLEAEMKRMESMGSILYRKAEAYMKQQKKDGKGQAAKITSEFWQEMERFFPEVLRLCNANDEEARKALHVKQANAVLRLYDAYCPNETANQMLAWRKHRPVWPVLMGGKSHGK